MRLFPSVSERLRRFFQPKRTCKSSCENGSCKTRCRPRSRVQLYLEPLEERLAPSVTNTFVDDDWVGQPPASIVFFPGDPNPHIIGVDAFATINDGKNNTNVGGNIHVAPGDYTEQIFFTQDVHLLGSGQNSTTIHNPGSLTPTPSTGQTAIIDISNSANVSISDVAVSGPGFGYADLTYGIFVGGNANLNISDSHITHIRDATFSGVQSGVGIRIGANFASQVATGTITNVTFDDYQKGGIVVDGIVGGPASYATITGCTITGAGATPLIAQNGIQVSRGANATITGNTITNHYYNGPDTGSGMLFFRSNPADSVISGNTFSGNQYNLLDSTSITKLTSSLNPAPSDPTFTATVSQRTPSDPPSPTPLPGTVQFYVDGVPTGSPQPLDANNKAYLTLNNLSVGCHDITAVYSGTDLLELETSTDCIRECIFPPPPPTPPDCPTCCPTDKVKNPAKKGAVPPSTSKGPVRYFDGVVSIPIPGLSSNGFGTPWGQDLYWTNGPGYATQSVNGNGITSSEMPYLLRMDEGLNTIVEMSGGAVARYFDLVGGSYQGRFFDPTALAYDGANQQYVMTDSSGDKLTFYDFSDTLTDQQKGSFKSYTDPAGNVTSVISHNADGKITEVQRSAVVGGDTITESFLYTYVGSGPNEGLLDSVTLRRQTNAGPWDVVRKVEYAYYDGVEANGNQGDLKTTTLFDGNGGIIDTTYNRYYVASEVNGYQGGLKFSFDYASFARLQTAVGNPFTATDAQIAPYANNYFQYDSNHRVTLETVQGVGCSACSGGQGTFTFSYTTSSNPDGYNSWHTKTVETLPDGNENIVYTNVFGEVMLSAFHDTTTDQKWDTFYQYDGEGKVLLSANPSAVTGYDDTFADLLHNVSGNYQFLSDNAGLITTYSYYSTDTGTETTPGGAAGYEQSMSIQRGELGTPILQHSEQYFTRTTDGATTHPIATMTVYRNDNGTGAETTSYAYTWFAGSTRIQSMTVSLPVVSAAQNGPGTPDVSTAFFDVDGRPIWQRDAGGFLSYMSYDEATGALAKMIRDVDTTRTSEFTNLPAGWTTPVGGGLHLVSTMEVDGLGRTVKSVDPNGNITYTVFKDVDHEARAYTGWNSTTLEPTGPTQVQREDRPGSYFETLTMSATPSVDLNGRPTGTEAVSNLQTLSRRYISAGGQMVRSDAYFNLTGLAYSTAPYIGAVNVNFYTSLYGYDDRGRLERTETPTGTIYHTVYDGLSRKVSRWVGTDDTHVGDHWAPDDNDPPANMIQVSANIYDNGGVGDSNLTQTTESPGGADAPRVNQFYFDWRDRRVAAKGGVEGSESLTLNRPIFYTEFNNLNQIVAQEQYDGDGVIIVDANNDGVPDKPSSSLLRARSTSEYDDQGRVFRTHAFNVNQTNGTFNASLSLTTNYFLDHRGNLVKTSLPGGLVIKSQYDGAGRVTVQYTSDGRGDSTWADALNVIGDRVLTQTETHYDANGNDILTVTRDRFHDENGFGALGTPTSAIKARVSYLAKYYDAIDRITDLVNVGTNGSTAYSRPASVPARSDTVLVTSYAYSDAGWLSDVTDPRAIVAHTDYDALRRTTRTIQAYTDGVPSTNDDKTTLYTYDGSDHMLTLTAVNTGGAPNQTTQWVYGVTTVSGSSVNSNDVLAAMQYPDKVTGLPSASEQETYTVNALGQQRTVTDRNGSTHTLTYDVLGRITSDAVTTLGAGVGGTVRRIETVYDTAGRAFKFTSYDSPVGGSVVNEVLQVFNGLNQLTSEYQAHGGQVNLATTPKVQYTYSEMAGGANHSRLTSMIYPNGRTITYNYAGALNDAIGRLSSISDSSGTLEQYEYLGPDTVVDRFHPQTGVRTTYIKKSSDPVGDAGDQYTGLDRFGRIVDQVTRKGNGNNILDRFQYTYDRDSNRTSKNNPLHTAFNETYGYDSLNQLTNFARNDGHTQSWSTDALGNFTSVSTDGAPQARTHNAQNQIATVGANALTFDANGNMTKDETGRTFEYDAWNRLVRVKAPGGATLITYSYDAQNHRITETTGTVRDLYYSARWQVVEERVGGVARVQYVWSPVYVDAMILRDRDTDNNGTLDERLWAVQDANWNVTALVNNAGNVVERFAYDPYGVASVFAPNWSARGSSLFGWNYLHQGGRFEALTGLYYFRNRDYSATLSRWTSLDPIRIDDTNLYRYVKNRPTDATDPTGLQPCTVQLRCRPVQGFAGRFADHCFVVTQDGATQHRYSMYPAAGGDFAQGSPPMNFVVDDPRDQPNAGRAVPVNCGNQNLCCVINRIAETHFQFSQFNPPPYNTAGPNSNTAAYEMLSHAGCRAAPGARAIGFTQTNPPILPF